MGCDLCFKVDGKLFAVTALEPGTGAAQLQVHRRKTSRSYASGREYVPRPIWPEPNGSALEQLNTLPDSELRELIAESYRLVWERLPKRRREELQRAESRETPSLPEQAPRRPR